MNPDSHQNNGHKHTKRPWDYILAGKLVKKIQKSCIKPKSTYKATVSQKSSETKLTTKLRFKSSWT